VTRNTQVYFHAAGGKKSMIPPDSLGRIGKTFWGGRRQKRRERLVRGRKTFICPEFEKEKGVFFRGGYHGGGKPKSTRQRGKEKKVVDDWEKTGEIFYNGGRGKERQLLGNHGG